MENVEKIVETFEKFRWTIKDLSIMLYTKVIYSQSFFIDVYPWRILMFPKGNKGKVNNVDLSIYLDVADSANLPDGGTIFLKFQLILINQLDGKMTKTKEIEHTFNAEKRDWGFNYFIADLYDDSKGFIVNDTCIIEVKIPVGISELEKIVDFKGLGKIENAFVPLLDEASEKHPSVIECQRKKSQRFREWAFTALGRVLHFLKTKKVRDMNEEACDHLQILWEELETFRFDLSWLEPHVQSALRMKNYMERSTKVKNAKENVAALEMEMKKLKEMARRELVKVEEGFEEKDLDDELGYGL